MDYPNQGIILAVVNGVHVSMHGASHPLRGSGPLQVGTVANKHSRKYINKIHIFVML